MENLTEELAIYISTSKLCAVGALLAASWTYAWAKLPPFQKWVVSLQGCYLGRSLIPKLVSA